MRKAAAKQATVHYADKCNPWHVGKRPSFIETATDRLRFLVDDEGFLGPETEKDKFFAGVSTARYQRNDMTIEVVHVVGPMGEAYVETRCRRSSLTGISRLRMSEEMGAAPPTPSAPRRAGAAAASQVSRRRWRPIARP